MIALLMQPSMKTMYIIQIKKQLFDISIAELIIKIL